MNIMNVRDNEDIRPLLFVAMPFGRKKDEAKRIVIDFDDVYERAVLPAAEKAGVEVIRADEEVGGGFIHQAMYERLLLAEIVIADLTLLNANVFYELGVRHAARPRSTILIYAKVGQLPFDLAPIRALPYELENGKLTQAEANALRDALVPRLEYAKENDSHDSPLFQLINDYPGINLAHEVTEAFRDRVRIVTEMTTLMRELRRSDDRTAGLSALHGLEKRITSFEAAPPELIVDLLLAYRDYEAWDDMIRWVEQMPDSVGRHVTLQEQLALALNRRNGPGDRPRAVAIVHAILSEQGSSAETYSIGGRIYKDEWQDAKAGGDGLRANAALQEAISLYGKGFETDPRDYYPGINYLTLLKASGTAENAAEFERVYPAVSFAVARLGGTSTDDYWQIATVIELAALKGDEPLAVSAAGRALMVSPVDWERRTTARNLRVVATLHKEGSAARLWVNDLASYIEP